MNAEAARERFALARWLDLAVLVVVIDADALIAWYVPSIGVPIWLAPLIVGVVGAAALTVLNLVHVRPTSWTPRRRVVTSSVLVAISACSIFIGWAITMPAKISGDAAATRIVDELLRRPTGSCDRRPADLASVGSLLHAGSVCVDGVGAVRWVDFMASGRTPAIGVPGTSVEQGLLYTTRDPWADPRYLMNLCLRHLTGPWWAYQQLVLQCPFGYQGLGAA